MDFKDWINFDGSLDKAEYTKRFLIIAVCCIVLRWIPGLGWFLITALGVPLFAAVMRRLRGLSKTPWLSLLLLIPFVGLIFAIWLAITD